MKNLISAFFFPCFRSSVFLPILRLPLLFILYINDLPLSLKYSQVNMYADDTSISFSANCIPVINERVNEDLDSLRTWLAANKLSLNVAKTHSLIIGGGKN